MKYLTRVLLAPILIVTGPVLAEVTDAEPGGFTTVNEVVIAADRIDVWKASIDDVGQWWNSDHTVAGDARRMSISAVPQGCFCERFESGGGVVHMSVTMVNPGVIIRLTGGLGPLGLMGVEGNMTWEFEDAGGVTVVRFTYAVGGYRAGGLDAVAGPVDAVVGEALNRLKVHVESRDSDSAGVE
ncbi:MAG TPA: hypothetical protein PKH39_13015 [Woeseiaceae bacterium]|nr:hypothetical protein [Woeseiaceae bacterium]